MDLNINAKSIKKIFLVILLFGIFMISGKNISNAIEGTAADPGWVKEGNSWYYIREDGNMVKDKWLWVKNVNGIANWKYFDPSGKNVDQFYIDSGMKWLSPAGPYSQYQKGWWTNPDNGFTYYFRTSSGTRVDGWQWIGGSWKYFRTSGTLCYEWQFIDGSWRYFDSLDGSITIGERTIDGVVEVFDDQGRYLGEKEELEKEKAELAINAKRQEIVDLALAQLGKPYVFAAAGPNAFDCSGLTSYVYKNVVGITIPRRASLQANVGKTLTSSELQKGDLMFFEYGDGIAHVAIYIGDGQYVHASTPDTGVIISSYMYGFAWGKSLLD